MFIKTGKSTQTFFSKLTIDVYNFIDADMKETTMCWQNNRNVDQCKGYILDVTLRLRNKIKKNTPGV